MTKARLTSSARQMKGMINMDPLQNKKVLITREINQAKAFTQKIEALGGLPLIADVLKITCTGKETIPMLQEERSDYGWLFFTSANGVTCFFRNFNETDEAYLRHVKIAVVGGKTNEALEKHGKTADFIPSVYNARTMGKEFLENYPNPGKIIVVRGSKARPELAEILSENGFDYDLLEVYKNEINKAAKKKLETILLHEAPDYVTFTSPSAVDALCELASPADLPVNATIVCIGTTTEQRAMEQGLGRRIIPDTFTIEGMLRTMQEHALKGGNEI